MKRFIGFVRKEWIHILRDKRTLLVLFGMPILQILLFGYAVNNEIREAKLAIHAPGNDPAVREIINRIVASGYFELDSMLPSATEAEAVFQQGQVKLILLFESNFEQKLTSQGRAGIQILADATDPNTSNTLINYILSITGDYQRERNLGQTLPMTIGTEVRMRYNPEQKGVYLFVPGLIAVILMLVSAMMTSISITREKEMGNMELMLVSPIQPLQMILGKVTPYVLLSLVDAIVILVMGYYVFGVPMQGSVALLLAEALIFIVAALSLGILISIVSQSQQVALMLSLMGLMLPTILLSGAIFPVENMPWILQVISNIIPARWFVIITKGIMLQGLGLQHLWQETLVLAGFSLFFLMVSMRRFKIRLA